MRKRLIFLSVISVIILFIFILFTKEGIFSKKEKVYVPKYSLKDYVKFSNEAHNFCKSNNLNTDFFILIDLSIHSGKKRFFLWNFKKKNIDKSFLVSHGCGSSPWNRDGSKMNPCISNVDGSHCSSVGKYILTERGNSSWGVKSKYLMKGLEPTNSNATKREIVFHSWEAISDEEVYPKGTPEGWGCPAVSNNTFVYIDKEISSHKAKTLMWIIN